ncbi:hypothetical protein MKW92_052403, partial [Papaver armeniacum]
VKPYMEDPFLIDIVNGPGFDGRDPITGGLVGAFKRKKDTSKQADCSEAELERVQKMQEQERQQILDEQTRAVELARKEDEDRKRFARDS